MTTQIKSSTTPLKVAVLAHLHHPIASPFAGGMESHTAHLVTGLSLRGHHVSLYAKQGSHCAMTGVPVQVHNVLGRDFMVRGYPDDEQRNEQHKVLDGAMWRSIEAVRTGNFDVVINNSLSPIPHHALDGIPTLHILHTPPLPRITSILAKRADKRDDRHRYVTVSESNAQPWREWLPELAVVPNGIDLNQWRPVGTPVPGTAAWTGRITAEKGTHLAIAAAQMQHLNLKLAGPIQDREYFADLVQPQLGRNVEYLGHLGQQTLRELIGSAQVFISSPLWEEPFGLTTLEAMACGTPVAALPAGAMKELLGATGGVLAGSKDAQSLAVAIEHARSLDRLGVQNRAQNFSLYHMLVAYEELLYDTIVQPQASLRSVQ